MSGYAPGVQRGMALAGLVAGVIALACSKTAKNAAPTSTASTGSTADVASVANDASDRRDADGRLPESALQAFPQVRGLAPGDAVVAATWFSARGVTKERAL